MTTRQEKNLTIADGRTFQLGEGDLVLLGANYPKRASPDAVYPILGVVKGVRMKRIRSTLICDPGLFLQMNGYVGPERLFPTATNLDYLEIKDRSIHQLFTGTSSELADLIKNGRIDLFTFDRATRTRDDSQCYRFESEWVRGLEPPYAVSLAELMAAKAKAMVEYYRSGKSVDAGPIGPISKDGREIVRIG